MSWQQAEHLPWQEPLAAAAQCGGDIALLYSSLSEAHSGRYSFLFSKPLEVCEGESFAELQPSAETALPDWVGYLGYGLRDPKKRGASARIHFPDFRLVRYGQLLRFDHEKKCVEQFARNSSSREVEQKLTNASEVSFVEETYITDITSNLTRTEYEASVARTVEAIHAGDFYQANLTRKFFGNFSAVPDSFSIFQKLVAASPAPYSAFIRHGVQAILSSSPECFLSISADGTITTRPIKGSARRSSDEAEDKKIRAALAASEKNHAENLMIVDLMRNDLSRVCNAGSVKVTEQSGLYSYATIHHLISTITGKKRAGCSVAEVLRACFPAGSMTGAPKIAAMRWCEREEKLERGVYSGAIGWLNANACDFSVVIRTLLVDGERFEFQVGGGIVADSTPTDEWRETLAKARGICTALGIEEEKLSAL